jgi:hypothetical protein
MQHQPPLQLKLNSQEDNFNNMTAYHLPDSPEFEDVFAFNFSYTSQYSTKNAGLYSTTTKTMTGTTAIKRILKRSQRHESWGEDSTKPYPLYSGGDNKFDRLTNWEDQIENDSVEDSFNPLGGSPTSHIATPLDGSCASRPLNQNAKAEHHHLSLDSVEDSVNQLMESPPSHIATPLDGACASRPPDQNPLPSSAERTNPKHNVDQPTFSPIFQGEEGRKEEPLAPRLESSSSPFKFFRDWLLQLLVTVRSYGLSLLAASLLCGISFLNYSGMVVQPNGPSAHPVREEMESSTSPAETLTGMDSRLPLIACIMEGCFVPASSLTGEMDSRLPLIARIMEGCFVPASSPTGEMDSRLPLIARVMEGGIVPANALTGKPDSFGWDLLRKVGRVVKHTLHNMHNMLPSLGDLVEVNMIMAIERHSNPPSKPPDIYKGYDFDEFFSGSKGTISKQLTKSGYKSHFRSGLDKAQNKTHDVTKPRFHDAQWGPTLSESPRVLMGWLPSKLWTPACTERSTPELQIKRKEELEWIIKPMINASIGQHQAGRYFLLEIEDTSDMLKLPVFKTLMKATTAYAMRLEHSRLGSGYNSSSRFITNIPKRLLEPLKQDLVDRSSSPTSTERRVVYDHPKLAQALFQIAKNTIIYHRSTNDLLQVDVLENMISYIDSLDGETSSSVIDSGCQHTCLNIKFWRTLVKDSLFFSARGYFGKATNIETGTCAAVAKDSRGREVLLVINSAGLVHDRASLIDPYQLMAGGSEVEHVVTKRCLDPFIEKDGVIIPLTLGKDVTLDVAYPTLSQIESLPRIYLTSEEPWSRALYMQSLRSEERTNESNSLNINRNKVVADSENLKDPEEDSDDDNNEPDAELNPKGIHSLPSDIWWFIDKNVRRRTSNATTAFISARKGKDILVRRKALQPIAHRRIRDKASHDTLFSTVPARHCGSTMLQVFATRKSRFLYGVPMTQKSQVLPSTEDFFRDVGIPTALRSDNATENHSTAMKELLKKRVVTEEHTEEFQQFENPVERWIGFIKRSVFKILHHSKAPPDEWLECANYVIACHNKTARKSLHWRTPWEMVCGDTPDVSELIDYSFYQPIYYVADPDAKTFPEPDLHEAYYLGPSYHHGGTLCHWIRLPDGSKISKSLLRPNYDLKKEEEVEKAAEKQLYYKDGIPSDAHNRGASSKAAEEKETSVGDHAHIPEEHNEADQMVEFNNDEEGGEEEDDNQPALTSVINESVWIKEGGKQVTATVIRDYYMNFKRRVTVRIRDRPDEDWTFIRFQKLFSVKDRHRDSNIPYSFTSLGKFKVLQANIKKKLKSRIVIKVSWNDGTFTWEPFENIKEDDSVSLAGYAVRVFKNPSYSAYKKNRVLIDSAYMWAVDYLANNANLNVLASQTSNIKFGVKVPKGIRGATTEDAQYENDQLLSATVQHQRWSTAMNSEQANFDKHDAFEYLPKGTSAPHGYQQMRCHFVYDVKSDGKFKARFCAGGDSVDATGVHSAMTVVETPNTRILFVTAEANGQEVLVGDLSSAYLHAYTKEKVYFICGPEWGPEREGCVAIVIKAVYGLVGSAHAYHQHVFETMSSKGWKCSEIDSDIWLRKDAIHNLWEYVAFYVDDFIIVSKDPARIGKELNAIFSVKEITEPNKYLGANVKFVEGRFRFSSETYLKEVLSQLRGESNIPSFEEKRPEGIRKFNNPMITNDHPEMDDSDLLNEKEKRIYQRLMGILQWMVSLGRFDICYAVSSLSRFNSAPRKGHMQRAIRVFGYLEQTPKKCIEINCNDLINLPQMEPDLHEEMKKKYPDAVEERSSGEPEMLGKALNLTVYADADHAHDQVTRRSITGIIVFIGSTPIIAKSTRQGSVESSTYSAEFNSARAATELIIGLRLLLRSLGISQDKPSLLLGDNLGVVQNATLFTSALKKKHNAISFHRVREAVAAGIIAYAHIDTALNLADIFTKPLDSVTFGKLRDTILRTLSVIPWSGDWISSDAEGHDDEN